MWQDARVENLPAETPPQVAGSAVRVIEDVETLKAIADPIRLAILTALTKSAELPVMSVKELAAELGEPQTKLYRHIKQLEAAGLIRVAASRMVSGILEQRYQASHVNLRLGPALISAHPAEADEAVRAAFDLFLDGLPAARDWDGTGGLRPLLSAGTFRLTHEDTLELRRRLTELRDWLNQLPDTPDATLVHFITGFYIE